MNQGIELGLVMVLLLDFDLNAGLAKIGRKNFERCPMRVNLGEPCLHLAARSASVGRSDQIIRLSPHPTETAVPVSRQPTLSFIDIQCDFVLSGLSAHVLLRLTGHGQILELWGCIGDIMKT